MNLDGYIPKKQQLELKLHLKNARWFFLVLVVMFSNVLVQTELISAASQPNNAGMVMKQQSSTLTYNYDSGKQSEYQNRPEPPNVWNVIDNITQFNAPNTTVYTGSDIIPSELIPGMSWSLLEINISAIYVFDDKDIGYGEIYIKWIPNYWVGIPDSTWSNYEHRYGQTAEYSITDADAVWYNFSQPIQFFCDWTVLTSLYFEVYDSDPDYDDSLGVGYWLFQDPTDKVGYHQVWTSTNDAVIAMNVRVIDTFSIFTAEDLTELFQPYLFDNDGTNYNATPDELYGRVIHGYDSEIGMGSLCIQYLYFWDDVYLPVSWATDPLIHYFDYELVQVYLNLTYTGGPMAYRFVFDNHDIVTGSSTEWRDSMEYTILEIDRSNTGTLTSQVSNSPELKALLGDSYAANYKYKNLWDYLNMSSIASCYGGVVSILLSLATYNHQFAIGNTGGNMLGQYNIQPYTDDVIYACYGLLNRTFTQGKHTVYGQETPDYAPFAYDVFQVFTVPYIHSNFNNLMQQAVACQGSTESKGGWLKIERRINITIEIPVDYNCSISDTLTPGENFETILNTHIKTNQAKITIGYYFNISADVDLFFYKKHFETIVQNTMTIDFANPILQLLMQKIGMQSTYQSSKEFLSGMLSIESAFTPQIIGEILNCNITFHIDEILKQYFPQYSFLVDLFFEDVYLKINPIVYGSFTADLMLGSGTNALTFDEPNESFPITLVVPAGSTNKLLFKLDNFNYVLGLKVDWYAGIDFGYLLDWFLTDFEVKIGTWPTLNATLPFTGSLQLDSYKYSNNKWILESLSNSTNSDTPNDPNSTDPGTSIDGFPVEWFMICLGLSAISIVRMSKRRKEQI